MPTGICCGPASCALNIAASPNTATRPLPTSRIAPWHHPSIGTLGASGVIPGAFFVSSDTEFAPNTRTGIASFGGLNAEPVKVTTFVTFSSFDRPRVMALQIDFDATSRERPFYGALLAQLRRLMPADWPLSITALASWCLGDPWIRDVPVDEAIPMLFRMGADGGAVRSRLDAGQDFSLAVCRASLGVSLDEPAGRLPSDRRRYVFNPTTWNERAVAQALRLAASVR